MLVKPDSKSLVSNRSAGTAFGLGLKLVPVQKRGGIRKTVKKRPTKLAHNIFTASPKGPGFPRKLIDYKYVISTNFTTDELCSLILFAGWVKANESALDSHSNFPIYSIITSPDKKEFATKFLDIFTKIFGWNDPTVDMHASTTSSFKRIWSFGEEHIEASPSNVIYLNLAAYSIPHLETSIHIGGEKSFLLPPDYGFLTPENSPKLFQLLNDLPIYEDEPDSELSPAIQMIKTMVMKMYEEADAIEDKEYQRHSGNVIPFKSQHYILGMIGASEYMYVPFGKGNKMVVKNKNTFVPDHGSGWLDGIVYKVFFEL